MYLVIEKNETMKMWMNVKEDKIMEKMFMDVNEVAEEMGISIPYAYKVIQGMNAELKEKNCFTMRGKIDRKFFYEHFYGTRDYERGDS